MRDDSSDDICLFYLFDLVGCISVGPLSVWNVYGVTSDRYSTLYKSPVLSVDYDRTKWIKNLSTS